MATDRQSLKRETILFLALTFGLTYLLNVGMLLKKDLLVLEQQDIFIQALQLEMMIPAFSAIALSLFVFKDRAFTGINRVFFLYYLLVATFAAIVILGRLFLSLEVVPIVSTAGSILVPGTLVLVAALHLRASWREELRAAGLAFGRPIYYLSFGLLFAGYFLVSGWLNLAFGLASPPSERPELGNLVLTGMDQIVISTVLGFALFFGEEFGWRIFLQDRLMPLLGRVRGVLLVGVIWGLWHAPVVFAFGWTYPGYPVLGVVLFTVFTVLMSILLGLAMLKSRSVLLAAFLHGIINNSSTFVIGHIADPHDFAFSFGVGVYGLPILAAIALCALTFKEWRIGGPSRHA